MTKREQSRRRVATGALLGLAAVSALAATVSTPVIPPPGSPGGNREVEPK